MENNNNSKAKLMCSYGGKINLRPHDHRLFYLGGDTKLLSVDRKILFPDLIAKLTSLTNSPNFALKYQLPGYDLDALVSVINGEDLETMLIEYDLMQTICPRPSRFRLFLFPRSNRFNPDFLFGFDKEYKYEMDPCLTRPGPGSEEKQKTIEKKIPCEDHVTYGYAVGSAIGQHVYLIPVTAGEGLRGVRFMCPELPVYSYVGPMPATVASEDGRIRNGSKTSP